MALPIAQSPSVQDLLSARSKRSHQNLATNSIYSTITTLSAKTELDLSESARLAMAQQSADPVWSPSMSSTYEDDDHTRNEEIDDDGSSTQNEHVHANTHQNNNSMYDQSPNLDMATPTMSESEYSRSPSLGSVRMAAIVQKAVPTSGLGISSVSSSSAPPSSSSSSVDNDQYTPTASPSKRVMNARNLIINTNATSAARPYPHQTTTPPIAMPNSAKIEHSPPQPLTSRSVPETLNITHQNSSFSPLRTATLPPIPHTAVPIRHISQRASQTAKVVRRSSTDSSLSYLSSPILAEDDSLGPHKASLLRMQSFLGPKMKHISPAPWSTDNGDTASVVSSSSRPVSEAASGIWSEIDSEIGSVHMATKSVARTGNNKSTCKDVTTPSTATGTLKGLGLAIASASAVVANAATGGSSSSRPSMSSERSITKSRTTTASSAFSTWSGTSRGTTNDGGRIGLPRSQSQEPFDASSIPLPPLPSPSAATAAMKVTNITRSKSPEHYPLPPSAVAPNFPPLSRSASPADKLDSEPGSEIPFSQLKTVASAPDGNATFTAASACIHALSSSLPENSIQGSSKNSSRKTPTLPRKRPPLLHQDSTYSNATSNCTGESYNSALTHSTSQTSLPAGNSDPTDLASKANSPNGMKLISLQDARERERERGNQAAEHRAEQLQQMQQIHQQQQQATAQRARQAQMQAVPSHQAPPPPHPTSAPPPPPLAKTLKSKKSGFLKLFKHKEDHSQAPAVPRPSTDSLPSPKISHGFAPNTRNVSGPTDPRKIDNILHIGPTSRTVPTSELRTPAARSDFASAVPFPHQRAPNASSDTQGGEEIRKSGGSAPPQVSLIKPSPDLSKTQGFFTDSRGGLSVQDHRTASKTSHLSQGDALAPSLSLRPVSMMLSSMPPNFLAEMEKSVKKGAHLTAVQTPGGSSVSSFDSNTGHTSPARTPDTPSFVFFDSDNNATPPSGQTPNTPATEQFNDSPSPINSSKNQHTKPVFGLPTPPHSASSARTFSASNLPPMPTSPSSSTDQAREHAITAAYKAKIVELEQLVIGLRAELNAVQGEPIQIVLSDSDCKDQATKKACTSCGCCCKTSANSVLSRPRVIGHGNMFSSGRG